VRLVAGTDGGIADGKPHGILPLGLQDLVSGGLGPAQALAAATSVSADALGLGARKGRLRAGFDADLLVVEGDPLLDIGDLQRVEAVYLAGQEVGMPVG
ncbi:MAG: hypothetical protein JWP61_2490, partial [Friedmanniella sp.]|nr:hypothetical protein [Friedmanniella sp.]